MKLIKRLFVYLFVIYIITIFFLCLYSFGDNQIDMPAFIFGIPIDKIAHFSMFLPFSTIAWLAGISLLGQASFYRSMIIAPLIGALVAMTAELSQNLNPVREFDLLDLAANFSGLVAGTLIMLIISKIPALRRNIL